MVIYGAHQPPLIAACALRFASNWYIKPGETKSLRWKQKYCWRPEGVRFAPAPGVVLVQIRCGGFDNLVQEVPAVVFGPPMTQYELGWLDGGATGTVINVPYTSRGPNLPVRRPEHHLTFATVPRDGELRLMVRNDGATPQIVDGAIFYAAEYPLRRG